MAPPIASIASRIEAPPVAPCTRGQIVAVDHDHVGADRLQRLGRAAAHHVDRADAVRLGEPDQVGADAGVGGVLDHPVARLQRHVAAQHQRGRRIDLEHGELEHVGIRGHRERLRGRHLAPLAPVVAPEIDHAIARRELPHIGADRRDPADALGADVAGSCGHPQPPVMSRSAGLIGNASTSITTSSGPGAPTSGTSTHSRPRAASRTRRTAPASWRSSRIRPRLPGPRF